jgi:hypothetical protein
MKSKIFIGLLLICFLININYLSAQQKIQTNSEVQIQNKGEEIQIKTEQIQNQENIISAGEYETESGKKLKVQKEINNILQIQVNNISANTNLEIINEPVQMQEQTQQQEQIQQQIKLKVKLSNGEESEIKIMPDTASENAIRALNINRCSEENDCQIELKEVGNQEQTKAVYEMQAQKEVKVLGLFKTKMQVKAQINAENGELIKTEHPWWSFLTVE